MSTTIRCFAFFLVAAACILAGYASGTALGARRKSASRKFQTVKATSITTPFFHCGGGRGPAATHFLCASSTTRKNRSNCYGTRRSIFITGPGSAGSCRLKRIAAWRLCRKRVLIAPGGSFEVPVWPEVLSRSTGPAGACSHSPMETCRNGVFLTVRTDGLEMSETVNLDLDFACAFP